MTINQLAQAGVNQAEHWSFIATIVGVMFTAVWSLHQWRLESARRREDHIKEQATKHAELAQREQELRWKQAELARNMFDAIFDYHPSNDAWRMVDGEEEGYDDARGNRFRISMALVRHALPAPWSDEAGGPQVYVRWCFDALFYSLEQLEHSLQLGLLRFEDLEAPASYYVALMAKDKKLFQDYAGLIRFRRAVKFLERFPEWRERLAEKISP